MYSDVLKMGATQEMSCSWSRDDVALRHGCGSPDVCNKMGAIDPISVLHSIKRLTWYTE